MSVSAIISNIVLFVISLGIYLYAVKTSESNSFENDKSGRYVRVILGLGTLFCIISFFGPEFIYPLNALAVIYMIYTGFPAAIALLTLFGTVTMITANETSAYFFYFMIPGIILLLQFRNPKEYFDVRKSVMYYSLSSILIYTALFLIYSLKITPERIVFPLVGLALNSLIVAIVMPKLAHGLLFTMEEKYSSIVDPEFHLLLKLKKENKYEFKRAIHSAYLSGRCADKVGADSRMARGCAYYHRIGVLSEGEDSIAVKTDRLIDENDFPEELAEMVKVCAGAKKSYLKKEVAIALICDELVSAIIRFMEEKPGENINFDALIDLIFERLSNRAPVVDSDLSLRDIRIIKKKLKEEKLYYDFLR